MIAVLSELISETFEKSTGINALPLKSYSKLDFPVSSHADMLICVIDNIVFCYNDYYNENTDLFDKIKKEGYNVVRVTRECSKRYPNDIALNVLVVGKMLFCNQKHVASEILSYAKEKNYKVIDVKQGYSACSTLVIDKNSVITADMGMKNALEKENIDVHLISSSGIKLSGYSCGFIGGSGVVINDRTYFFGNIKKHPSYEKIRKALSNKKINIFEIMSDDVCDFGGVKVF